MVPNPRLRTRDELSSSPPIDMQVIYSGGSATPSPSPRALRKDMHTSGYIRPVMPAYVMRSLPPPSFAKCQSRVKPSDNKDATLRNVIPAMSKPVAVICLVCNIFFPGLGTFISGLTLMCGSQVRPPEKTRSSIIWTNTWVAGLQLITTFLFLLGWIWSITWGIAFLSISDDYNSKIQAKNAMTDAAKNSCHRNGATSSNHGSNTTMRTTTTNKKPADDVMIALRDTPTMPV